MDEKNLDMILEQLQEINQEIKGFNGMIQDKVVNITEDVSIIRKEMNRFQQDVSAIREDIIEVKKLQKYILQMLENQQKLLSYSKDDSSVKLLH